eukprot:521003-Amphidinium_carterae.1
MRRITVSNLADVHLCYRPSLTQRHQAFQHLAEFGLPGAQDSHGGSSGSRKKDPPKHVNINY